MAWLSSVQLAQAWEEEAALLLWECMEQLRVLGQAQWWVAAW